MDIFDILEDKLNANSLGYKFKIFDQLHYHDEAIVEDDETYIQCILGSPAGSYLPLYGADIENNSRLLTILFPLPLKNDMDTVLKDFKKALVGFITDIDDTSLVLNMDVPIFSRIEQQALRTFSNEDGRFKFTSEPYGCIETRIYFNHAKDYSYGNDFILYLDDIPIDGITSFMIISSREVNSFQMVGEGSIKSYANAFSTSYHLTSLVNLSCTPLFKIFKQATSGNGDTYTGTMKIVSRTYPSYVFTNLNVLCSEAQVVMNKGDLATISFVLAQKGL